MPIRIMFLKVSFFIEPFFINLSITKSICPNFLKTIVMINLQNFLFLISNLLNLSELEMICSNGSFLLSIIFNNSKEIILAGLIRFLSMGNLIIKKLKNLYNN